MPQTQSNSIQFRAEPALLRDLDAQLGPIDADGPNAGKLLRAARSNKARETLHYFYYALAVELRTVNFTEQEALLVVDTLNSVLWEPFSVPLLVANVEDSIAEGLAEKWDVDGDALLAKLRALTYTQTLAVIAATRKWWNTQTATVDRAESLRAVGLLRTPRGALEP
jgi:hypothetical protein